MAISVTFNGATIFKPGAYSKLTIDLGGGFPLGPAGLVAIFGESTQGTPGADEIIERNFYTAEQLPEIRAKYGDGPLVDAASFLFSPAADAAIPSGASAVYIYKTNASTRASRALDNNFGTVQAEEYGLGGNRIKFKAEHTKEVAPSVTGQNDVPAFGAALDGKILGVRVNGEAKQEVTIAGSPADITALVAELQAGLTGVTVGNDGDKITITIDEDTDAHRKGWGKSISISGDEADFGIAGSQDFTTSLVESAVTLTALQSRDLIQEEDTVGGGVIMEVGYTGNAFTIATISKDNQKMTLMEDATATEYQFASYPTLVELANEINTRPGWRARLVSTLAGQLSPDILDDQSGLSVLSDGNNKLTGRLKRDYDSVLGYFNEASLVRLAAGTTQKGLMDETTNGAGDVVQKSLNGGATGGTSSAEIVNALAALEEVRVNSVIPLMSRDAADEIADGLTDPTSSYTIDAVHQAVKTHVNFMSTTKSRSERQGYLSFRADFNACRTKAENLADSRLQLMIQDIRQLDSQGNIKWFSPWALASILAGARGGSSVGLPLTNKFMNVSGIRHTAQSLNTPEEEIQIDFNPRTQADQGIISGITFLETPPTGGFKVVVDNTTYGRDGNWVLNRGNVRYAADILSFELRSQLEAIYVGQKNTVRATEVRSTVETLMGQFLAQGITVSTDDAPNGFKDLVVQIDGNIIRITIVAKLVEGIDFILADITVQRAQQTA